MLRAFVFVCLALPGGTAVFADVSPELEQDFQALRTYTLGSDFASCQRIIDAVTAVRNDPKKAAPLAARMGQALSEVGYDGQWFLCQWLYVIGTEREAPALTRLVRDRKTAPLALYALRAIPGKAVDQELMNLLRGTRDPHLLCGILDCLGKRKTGEALPLIVPLLRGGNSLVVRSAAQYLADIGTPEAVRALTEALARSRPPKNTLVADALLRACAHCPDSAAREKALDAVWVASVPDPLRIAARSLRVETSDEATRENLLYGMLMEDDPNIREAGKTLISRLEGGVVTLAAARAMADCPSERRHELLELLIQRADPQAFPYVYSVFRDTTDANTRSQLIRALGAVGDYRAAPDLISVLAGKEGSEQDAARDALSRMKDPRLNAYLISVVDQQTPAVKIGLIRILAARRAVEAVPDIFAMVRDADPDTAAAAVAALGDLAGDANFSDLAGLLAGGHQVAPDQLEAAIMSALRRVEDRDKAAGVLVDVLKKARNPELRAVAARALGATGSSSALPTLYREASRGKQAVRLAAIAALGKWKTPEPLEKLRKWAVSGSRGKSAVQEAAVNALLELLKNGNVPPDTALPVYRELLAAARNDEDMVKRVLAGTANLAHPEGINLLLPYLEDQRFAAEAAVALGRVLLLTAKLDASAQPEFCRNAMDGEPRTRWSTGSPQEPGCWFQFDFGRPVPLAGVMLDTTRTPTDFPRGVAVYVFDDPGKIGEPVAAVQESECSPAMTIKFPGCAGRFLRLQLTGTTDKPAWSIHEMRLITRAAD